MSAQAQTVAPAPATDLAVLERDTVLVDLRAKSAAAVELARHLVVDSVARKEEGIEIVARARKAVKVSEARRTALVKPHNDHVKRINEQFRIATDPFKQVDKIVTDKVLAFDREERQRAAAEAARAESERLKADALLQEAAKAEREGNKGVAEALLERAVTSETTATVAQSQAVIPAKTVAVESGTVSVRNKPWTFRVLDESAVPRELCSIDPVKVRAAIRDGAREIDGLEIFQEEGLAVR